MWAATGIDFEKEKALTNMLEVLKEEIKGVSDHFDLYEKGLVSDTVLLKKFWSSCNTQNLQDLQPDERSLDLGYLDHCLRAILSLTEHSSTLREELLNSPQEVAQVLVDITLATTHLALTHDSNRSEGTPEPWYPYEPKLIFGF